MAAAQNPGLLNLESELTCSICTEVLYQPLTLLDCLHTFCGSCLKEWFSSQASTSKTVTCPQCRASVRETRPNATVTTLLDMFLQVNPGQAKNQAEKDEIARIYKPGDGVLPKTRRRRQDPAEEEDRRLVDEVREMSLRDVGSGQRGPRSRRQSRETRSRSRETRDAAQAHRSRDQDTRRAPDGSSSNEPRPVHLTPSRQEGGNIDQSPSRQLEHQASLRSLLSNSDDGRGGMVEEILRQIREEGLLDGVNLDELDGAQEDALSERIADAYRRRHLQETEAQHGRRTEATDTISRRPDEGASARTANGPTRRPAEGASRRSDEGSSRRTDEGSSRRPHDRSHSSQSRHSEGHHTRDSEDRRPPVSRPHLLDAPQSTSQHRRSTSAQGRRQTSPGPRSSAEQLPPQATRSATDLSRPSGSRSPGSRPRQLSDTNRRTTEPPARVSDTWTQIGRGGAHRPSDPSDLTSQRLTGSPTADNFRHAIRPSPPGSPRHQETETRPATIDGPQQRRSRPRGSSHSTANPETPSERPSSSPAIPQARPSLYAEPAISCDRCGKDNIHYDLHRNCSKCKDGQYNLCLQCFRAGKGCLHWYGFGPAATKRYEAKAHSEGYPQGYQPPHVLTGQKYSRPKEESLQPSSPNGVHRLTTDDPSKRHQLGMFCDICEEFADDCYWKCGTCNEGEWGFCNRCVNQGRSCTHPLLPITHRTSARSGEAVSLPERALLLDSIGLSEDGGYLPLTFSTKCDICTYPIPPSTTRFHCPKCKDGDYNICTSSYLKLVNEGTISMENGTNGWRRCPSGHRMIVVGFEDHPEGQKRVIVKDLVGGYGLPDEKPDEKPGEEISTADSANPHWRWNEGPSGERRIRSIPRNSIGLPLNKTKIPPDGGTGMIVSARWNYFPDAAGKNDLTFPKGAEIRQAEDINGEWFSGVYAGKKGVFYAAFVTVIDVK